MAKEPGEPNVTIGLLPSGALKVSIDVEMTGGPDQWDGVTAGAWLADLWDRTLTAARLMHDYRVVPLGETPEAGRPMREPVPEPPARSYASLQEEARQKERDELTAAIERAEKNGTVAPSPAPRSTVSPSQWEDRLLSQLRQVGERGMTTREIQAIDSRCPTNRCKSRLSRIRERGLITFVSDGTHHTKGRWYLTAREAETEADLTTCSPLSLALPHTRGKVILVLGGDATPARVQALQSALQAKEIRWPTFYDQQPVEWRLREIRKAEVDLVLCTRWNRRYSRQYQHAAREWGKPFVMLTRGSNPAQVGEQICRQWVQKADLLALGEAA